MPLSREVQALVAEMNKPPLEKGGGGYGPGTVMLASDIVQPDRITTGSLAFDVALGGGWPVNQWHEIVGLECLAPGARVLTAALEWRQVEHLALGDEIVGFDEQLTGRGKGRSSKFRRAVVTQLGRTRLPSYRVTTSYGSATVASEGHLWVVQNSALRTASQGKRYQRHWLRTDQLKVGQRIAGIGPVWEEDESREAGYLAGFYDGEGWISAKGGARGNARLGVRQAVGETLDHVVAMHEKLGYTVNLTRPSRSQEHWQYQQAISLLGRYEDMRFLGSVRPQRLLPKSAQIWEGLSTNQVYGSSAVITSIEFLGEQEVVTIGTSTQTLLVDGMLSHNSAGKTTICLETVAANQEANPDFIAVWIAAEWYDPDFAEMCGVDNSRVVVVNENIAERAFGVALKWLNSQACDMLVMDSLPAMTPGDEAEAAMEEVNVALMARLTNKFFRKQGSAGKRAMAGTERPCTGLLINQWRDKIGIQWGDPRTTPGGNGKNYSFFTRTEVRQDDWLTYSPDGVKKNAVRVGQTIKCRVFKNKSAPPHRVATFDFYFEDADVHPAGSIDTFKEIVGLGVVHGVIKPPAEHTGKSSWLEYHGVKANGADNMCDALAGDLDVAEILRKEVLAVATAKKHALPVEVDPEEGIKEAEPVITVAPKKRTVKRTAAKKTTTKRTARRGSR